MLAVVAALDIADLLPWRSLQVYTVGAPRPGNAAFSKLYNAKIPDTWHIINERVRAHIVRSKLSAFCTWLKASQLPCSHGQMQADCPAYIVRRKLSAMVGSKPIAMLTWLGGRQLWCLFCEKQADCPACRHHAL